MSNGANFDQGERWAVMARQSYRSKVLHWLKARVSWSSPPARQLRLRETLALGERRFVAVVEFERQKFLIAGTSGSVVMLANLPHENGDREALNSKLPTPWPKLKDQLRSQEKVKETANAKEPPTWEFASEGTTRQLIRR